MSWCRSHHGHLFSALQESELISISSCYPWGNIVLLFRTEILLWEFLRPSPGVWIGNGEFKYEDVILRWIWSFHPEWKRNAHKHFMLLNSEIRSGQMGFYRLERLQKPSKNQTIKQKHSNLSWSSYKLQGRVGSFITRGIQYELRQKIGAQLE